MSEAYATYVLLLENKSYQIPVKLLSALNAIREMVFIP